MVYSLPPGNLRQRIAGICGKGLANNLLDVAVETSIVKIEGYVGHPSVAKKDEQGTIPVRKRPLLPLALFS